MTIKFHRISAFVYRHWLEVKHSIDRKAEIFFFPIIDILVFGFLTTYINRSSNQIGLAEALLGGIIFWRILYNMQRDIAFSVLDDVWTRNIFNFYSSPLRLVEVIFGTLLLSMIKGFLSTLVIVGLAASIFHFNVLQIGPQLVFYIFSLFIFAWAFGFLTAGIIFRYGTRVQAVAWSLVLLLYPFSGALYPTSVLPPVMATISKFLPISYIFENIRNFFLYQSSLGWHDVWIITGLNTLYITLAIIYFVRGHKNAKDRGWFVHPV